MARPRLPLLTRAPRRFTTPSIRRHQSSSSSSSSTQTSPPSKPHHDPYALLSTPTWSIRSLLPPKPTTSSTTTSTTEAETEPEESTITPTKLAHLLRLSALPQPTSASETAEMLATLRAQLHFVRAIQRVDTRGVAPLQAIRDETAAGLREASITLATVRDALAREEVVGRCRRPRRPRREDGGSGEGVVGAEEESWDVLGCAQEKVGRYFVVRSGKGDGDGDGMADGVE